jgi:protein-tyrosine phosphatase
MIDIHCHILPGLDDGAQTLEDALDLARIAVADGITDIVATPHTHDGIYRNDASVVLSAVAEFQQMLDAEQIPLRIHPGAEVHLHLELVENLLSNQTLTLGNQRKYLLLEFPSQSVPNFADDMLYELMIAGITPIIAHPERNTVLREDLNLLRKWVEQGALAQVTAGSLTGKLGERAKLAAQRMVQQRLAHLVASDAHNIRNRRPGLSDAYDLVPQEAEMFKYNAWAVLHGRPCKILEPIARESRKKRFFFF